MRPPALASNLLWAMIFSLAFMQPAIPLLGYEAVPTDFLFTVLLATWLFTLLSGRSAFVWDKAFGWLALYFAAGLASAVASGDPLRNAPALLKNLYLLSLPVLIVNLIRIRDDFRVAIRWWLAGSAIVALIGAVSLLLFLIDPRSPLFDYTRFHFGTLPPGDYPRLQLTFLNANMACNYLSVSLVLLLVARRLDWVSRPFFDWLLAGIALSSALTLSPGLGGIVLAIGLWIWLLERERRPAVATLALWSGVLVALLFLVSMAVTPIVHPTAPFRIHLPFGVELAPAGRLMVWIDAVRNFLAEPLFGRGLGIDAVKVHYQNPSGELQTLTDAHNLFLSVAVQCGIFGLAALAALLVFVFRASRPFRLAQDGRNVAIVGLGLALLVAFAYEGLGGSFEDARHLWALLGLFLVARNLDPHDDPDKRTVRTD